MDVNPKEEEAAKVLGEDIAVRAVKTTTSKPLLQSTENYRQ